MNGKRYISFILVTALLSLHVNASFIGAPEAVSKPCFQDQALVAGGTLMVGTFAVAAKLHVIDQVSAIIAHPKPLVFFLSTLAPVILASVVIPEKSVLSKNKRAFILLELFKPESFVQQISWRARFRSKENRQNSEILKLTKFAREIMDGYVPLKLRMEVIDYENWFPHKKLKIMDQYLPGMFETLEYIRKNIIHLLNVQIQGSEDQNFLWEFTQSMLLLRDSLVYLYADHFEMGMHPRQILQSIAWTVFIQEYLNNERKVVPMTSGESLPEHRLAERSPSKVAYLLTLLLLPFRHHPDVQIRSSDAVHQGRLGWNVEIANVRAPNQDMLDHLAYRKMDYRFIQKLVAEMSGFVEQSPNGYHLWLPYLGGGSTVSHPMASAA